MSENQEMTEIRGFDDEIDILLSQNEAEKSIKMLKPLFNSSYAVVLPKNAITLLHFLL